MRVGGVKFAEALMGPAEQPQQDQRSEEEIVQNDTESERDSDLSLEKELMDGGSMQEG